MNSVGETFVDGFGEVSFKFGMVRIELLSLSGPEPRVIQRLIMSVHAFLRMQEAQQELVSRLEGSGVIHSSKQSGPRLVQTPAPATEGPQSLEPLADPPRRGPPRSPNFATP